jgi:hypothetical protein
MTNHSQIHQKLNSDFIRIFSVLDSCCDSETDNETAAVHKALLIEFFMAIDHFVSMTGWSNEETDANINDYGLTLHMLRRKWDLDKHDLASLRRAAREQLLIILCMVEDLGTDTVKGQHVHHMLDQLVLQGYECINVLIGHVESV